MFQFSQYLMQTLVNFDFQSGTFDLFVYIQNFVILGLFAMIPGCDGKQKTLVGEL